MQGRARRRTLAAPSQVPLGRRRPSRTRTVLILTTDYCPTRGWSRCEYRVRTICVNTVLMGPAREHTGVRDAAMHTHLRLHAPRMCAAMLSDRNFRVWFSR